MLQFSYLCFVFAATVLGALLGIGAHFWRAHATLYAEKLFEDGDFANELFIDNYMAEKYVVGAEWDDAGFWAGDSVRNLAYYMISGALVPLLLGAALWDRQREIVGAICTGLAAVGLNPPLCP
jgi:hypothetical protein